MQSITVTQLANLGIIVPNRIFEIQPDDDTVEVEIQENVKFDISVSVGWIHYVETKTLFTQISLLTNM